MKKEFDFDMIGKETPYRVPEHFFEKMQTRVMKRVEETKPSSTKRPQLFRMFSYAAAAAAVVLIAFLMPHALKQTPAGTDLSGFLTAEVQWIQNLSDEDLEELVNLSEYDVFIDKE